MVSKIFKYLLIIALSTNGFLCFSQISVKSFEKREMDMTARIDYPQIDQNGDRCALIKVETTLDDLYFSAPGSGIFHVEQKVGEWWVYISHGARLITIQHPQLGTLRDYRYPLPIQEATVYLMKLTSARVETIVVEEELKTEWVVVQSNPEGAQVFINDRLVGLTPYSGRLNHGQHSYRLEYPMYHNEAGFINLDDESGRIVIETQLKPNYGHVYVKSFPEQGANILLNGSPTGQQTPDTVFKISSGKHIISTRMDMYYEAWEEVEVLDEEISVVGLEMNPAFGKLIISTDPETDIYINDKNVGTGKVKKRKASGFYEIEVRKPKHTPDKRIIEVIDGKEQVVTLEPKPKTGSIDVVSIPPLSDIYLDNENFGTTPTTISNLLIGEYHLQLRKDGYAVANINVEVKENETAVVEKTLSDGMGINISSNPGGADVYINNVNEGKTPLKINLTFGEHDIAVKNNSAESKKTISVKENGKDSFFFDVREGEKVNITSTPTGAAIKLNGEDYGRTPFSGFLLYGNYSIELTYSDEKVTDSFSLIKDEATNFNFPITSILEAKRQKAERRENFLRGLYRGFWGSADAQEKYGGLRVSTGYSLINDNAFAGLHDNMTEFNTHTAQINASYNTSESIPLTFEAGVMSDFTEYLSFPLNLYYSYRPINHISFNAGLGYFVNIPQFRKSHSDSLYSYSDYPTHKSFVSYSLGASFMFSKNGGKLKYSYVSSLLGDDFNYHNISYVFGRNLSNRFFDGFSGSEKFDKFFGGFRFSSGYSVMNFRYKDANSISHTNSFDGYNIDMYYTWAESFPLTLELGFKNSFQDGIISIPIGMYYSYNAFKFLSFDIGTGWEYTNFSTDIATQTSNAYYKIGASIIIEPEYVGGFKYYYAGSIYSDVNVSSHNISYILGEKPSELIGSIVLLGLLVIVAAV